MRCLFLDTLVLMCAYVIFMCMERSSGLAAMTAKISDSDEDEESAVGEDGRVSCVVIRCCMPA